MPSAMAKLSVRMWSAMTRKATSTFSCSLSPVLPGLGRVEPYFLPLSCSISSKIGRKMSVS
jgi:hypothetical protein